MKTHKCMATDCQKLISYNLAMCPQHWAMVPYDLQQQVYRSYRAPGRPGHIDNLLLAIRAVRKAEKGV